MFQVLQMWRVTFKQNMWLVVLAVFMILSVMLAWLWHRTQQAEEKYQQAVVLQQGQLDQAQALGKALQTSQMSAKELQAAYAELKAKPPIVSFAVNAPSLESAAEQVADRINKQDSALPPAALEKTDRTAVAKNDAAYKVDVLKINLDKSWEFSAGVGRHNGDTYLPIGVQRNYAAQKGVAAEAHLMPEGLARGKIKTSGWEVKHVWRY